VICNRHTLDAARRYCDRVIGMLNGSVVFDGPVDQLTKSVIREIYDAEQLDESLTTVSLNQPEESNKETSSAESSQ
jgi:phosphonate transport system ATP-binding protein